MKSNTISKFMLTLVLITGTITSCKDYLEVNPVSSFGPDYVFSNVTNATKAVLGVYASLGGDQGYGIRISMYYPYDNDEMMGQGGTPFPDNERRDIAHFNVQPSNTQLANPFNQLYAGIEKANICIYYIPRMEKYTNGAASEIKELKRLHGEALTLRAQFHYELIRNWGDVPAAFLPASLEPDLFKDKTDRDEIYARLLDDLAEAATLVPWRNDASGTNERITQGFVRGLRARIALAAGGFSLRKDQQMKRPANFIDYYQIARDETQAIMQRGDHQLNPSFQAVFKDALAAHRQEPFGEILWEVGMTGGSSSNGDSKLGYYNGPRYNNMGNSALTVLPTTFYAFDPQDARRDITCAIYNVNQDFTIAARQAHEIVDGKFRRDWITNPNVLTSTAQYFGVNWPMMRYSDVLLMFAEAENEINNGPTAAAYEAVNQVRRRGFAKPINAPDATVDLAPGLSKAAFFNALMKERMLELCGEGIRKYDLIRWNLLGSRLDEVKAELQAMATRQAPYDNLPTVMFYQPGQTTLNWLNSFYEPSPSAPPGSIQVNWITATGTGITNTLLAYYAIAFTPNKSELLPLHTSILDTNPKLTQDYGY